MYQIKSELNQILGNLEEIEKTGRISEQELYDLIEKAYFIISDSFDIEQCHSTVHQLKAEMRDIRQLKQVMENKSNTSDVIRKALDNCKKELEIFVSHL